MSNLESNDYALSGSYRAKYFNIDEKTKVWVPSISSIKTEITTENIEQYKHALPDAIWLSTDIADKTSEIGSCWVVFENSNINYPIIAAFLGDSVKQATSNGTPANPDGGGEENNPTPQPTGKGGPVWPVGGNGGYDQKNYPRYKSSGKSHPGTDISGIDPDKNAPIYSVYPGKVLISEDKIENGKYVSYGRWIKIESVVNGETVQILYCHLKERLVDAGDTVYAGTQIGIMGSTGNSTGEHLHYEVRKNGVAQNPHDYLPSR